METAIEVLKEKLNEKEKWIQDSDIDEYDELALSLINQKITSLRKAIDLLISEYGLSLIYTPEIKKRFDVIKKFVCEKNMIPAENINTRSHKREIVEARQIMFRIYYDLFKHRYPSPNSCFIDIGNYFNRDRNNVRYGIEVTYDVKMLDNRSKLLIMTVKHKFEKD